jgi:hypothetical protein
MVSWPDNGSEFKTKGKKWYVQSKEEKNSRINSFLWINFL